MILHWILACLVTVQAYVPHPELPDNPGPDVLPKYNTTDLKEFSADDCKKLQNASDSFFDDTSRGTKTWTENGGARGLSKWYNRGVSNARWSLDQRSRTIYCQDSGRLTQSAFEGITQHLYCNGTEEAAGIQVQDTIVYLGSNDLRPPPGQQWCFTKSYVNNQFDVDGIIKKRCGCKNQPPIKGL